MSEIEIIEGDQGDDAWRQMRLGLPTASCFSQIMAQGEGKVRDKYLRKLAAEIITGEPLEGFRNAAMDRGNAVEPELRASFQLETGLPLRQIAFVRRKMPFGMIGASPDSLINDDAGLEIKSTAPDLLIDILRSNKAPGEFIAQVQGCMLTTGRSAWWLAIGYPGMPLAKWKINRDTAYCARLEVGLSAFQDDLDEMVRWLKNYGK